MYSELLKENGLVNLVGGSDYNFRLATAEATFSDDVKRLLKAAEIEPKNLYAARQVHDIKVAYVDGENGDDYIVGRYFEQTDGLITDKKNIALLIKFADCTPIVLYDPVEKVQAVVHSGWRGTVDKISHVAILKMVEEFGSKKENILAYVGPSIAQENYEVGPEVYAAFSEQADRELYFKEAGEKYLLDMARANYELLLEMGILEENIEVEPETTYISPKLHSARQEGINYGLNAIVTMMT
jgi:hypothetical protein